MARTGMRVGEVYALRWDKEEEGALGGEGLQLLTVSSLPGGGLDLSFTNHPARRNGWPPVDDVLTSTGHHPRQP